MHHGALQGRDLTRSIGPHVSSRTRQVRWSASRTSSFTHDLETRSDRSEWVSLPHYPPPSTKLQVPKMRKPKWVDVTEPCRMWLNIQQVDLMLEKIYANMSACHLKQENWKRAIDTADKVTTTCP
jgi:hypothetical protein